MPCPYPLIWRRETALPSPLYHSGAAGIDIISYYSKLDPYTQLLIRSRDNKTFPRITNLARVLVSTQDFGSFEI